IPVIHLDDIIYADTEVLAVLKPGGDPEEPEDYELVRGWRLLDFPAEQSVNVTAESDVTIEAFVGGAAAAVSGGAVAASGAVGLAIGRNLVGVGDAGMHRTHAYIADSEIIASGDILVQAHASEDISADVVAGSVAIAVGIGGAIAGAGANVENRIASSVQAFARDSDLYAFGDIDILAHSDSRIDKATAAGAAVSASLGAASIAVSIVDNSIANDVDAYIRSTGDVNEVKADGDLTVRADVAEARIVAEAATASVSAGLVGLSGGGIGINNLIANAVDSRIEGNLLVETAGHVSVEADENAYLGGRAVSLAVSFSLGAAVGASDVINTAASTINASITGATVISRGQFDAGGNLVGDINVHANSDLDINNTDTAGISASLVGVTVNLASAVARNIVSAGIRGADISAENGTVRVVAEADNAAEAKAMGGAVGALAVGAMKAQTMLGSMNLDVEEVVADIGDDTVIKSGA